MKEAITWQKQKYQIPYYSRVIEGQLKLQMYIHVHVGTAWRLKGHNPGLKGFRCVQLHNVWWQQIPIPHCSWEKWHLSNEQTLMSQALVAWTHHPPFSNFLFTNLFSIKCLYFFIISSLFHYFNLFVSIFIQFYANIKLHWIHYH
jgi:hypothetical protein